MESAESLSIRIIEPVGTALEKTKRILFPFDLKKWAVLGFCAWLAALPGNFGFGFKQFCGRCTESQTWRTQIESIPAWLIPLLITGGGLLLAFLVFLFWVKSRGVFLFLHGIVSNQPRVAAPWRMYAGQGNSLFLFSLALALAAMLSLLPLILFFIVSTALLSKGGMASAAGGMLLAASLPILILLVLLQSIVSCFTHDFAAPLMMLRQCRTLQAWSELLLLLRAFPGKFFLYFLFQGFLNTAIVLLTMLLLGLTCCLCCTAAIPFVGSYLTAVFLLPLSVFRHAYALDFLAQFGPAYNLWGKPDEQPPFQPPNTEPYSGF